MKPFLPLLLISSLMPLSADEAKLPSLDEILLDAKIWENGLESVKAATEPKKDEAAEKRSAAAMEELMKQLKEEGYTLASGSEKGFAWLSSQKEGLRARPGNFKLLGKALGEVVMRGNADSVDTVDISLYNRGDNGEIKAADFESRYEDWRKALEEKLGTRGSSRDQRGAVPIRGMMWTKDDSAFLLESSWNKSESRAEFIRLRMASVSGARNKTGKVVRRASLEDNVKKDAAGFTYVDGIPMVDQGEKGYCVVATVERVGRLYGLEMDQHEMAQLANTTSGGTNGDELEEAFKKVTGKIHVRTLRLIDYDDKQLNKDMKAYNRLAKKEGAWTMDMDTDEWIINPVWFWSKADKEVFRTIKAEQNGCEHFQRKIKEYVDQGTPLCWTLFLGMFPEKGLPQSFGGHMRLITGYNYDGDVPKIYYSDSWGEGHHQKTMRLDEAYCMTMGLYAMVPNR
ncbi:C39 family peptidase [Akkermansiaceae bacterium]|nr:C39 family peptidase [Akkermansiaceae bacterium]